MSESANTVDHGLFPECEDCQQTQHEISCFKKIAGILSSEEVKQHNLIPFAEIAQFSPTVYDLSLGDFHYVYEIDDNGKSSRTPVCIGSANAMKKENKIAGDAFVRQSRNTNHSEFRIPALGAALIQLNEIVDTLTIAKEENILVTGRFDLKLSLVNRGLVSQQGTQIEPCYKGRLYCFVHNFSSDDIVLKKGQKIASVEFSYVSCFCNSDKRQAVRDQLISANIGRYKADEYCDPGKGIINVRYFSSRPNIKLPEACGLLSASVKAIRDAKEAVLADDISQKIKQLVIDEVYPDINKEKIKSRTSIIVAIITSGLLFLGVCLTAWITTIQPMLNDNAEYRRTIAAYEQKITDYETDVDDLENRIEELEKVISDNSTTSQDSNE